MQNPFIKIIIIIFSAFLITTASAKETAVLRVGTTGDYPPLTNYDAKTHQYAGFDIDIAKNLSLFLNRKIEFVKITWPTLAQDLTAGKFDIAMGGISKSPERAKQFLLSKTIFIDGKIPLIRCVDIKKYTDLTTINQPYVRVVENKGGTNEKFAKLFLKNTQLILVKNNQATIQYLLNNQADVMMTDRTEALYRQKHIQGLCAVNPQKLYMPTAKVYMVNKSNYVLATKVDQWIKLMKRNGCLKAIKTAWDIH